MPSVAQNTRKRRRTRADFTSYRFLLGAPVDLGALVLGVPSQSVALPASCTLGIRGPVQTVDGDLEVDVNGKRYPVRALKWPSFWYSPGWFERDKEVSVLWVKGGDPGLVELGARGPTNPDTYGYATFATAGVP